MKWDYITTFFFSWAAIISFLLYCFVWDLRFLTFAIGLSAVSVLTKKAEDWANEKAKKEAGRNEN